MPREKTPTPPEPAPKHARIGSRQDGDDPNKPTDLLSEKARPGQHGGAGSPGWKP
jgi:hypothetical protein